MTNAAAGAPRIELATPADGGDVFELFSPFGWVSPDLDRTTFAESWKHQFFGAERGSGCVYVARDGQGQVVAHFGAVPFPYLVHGKRQWGGFLSQLFVHPSYRRGTSLFPDLERTLLAEHRRFGLDFLYCMITIKPMLKAHLNLGFARGPDLSIYAFPLALGKGLTSIRPGTPRLLASGLNGLSGVASRAALAVTRRTLEVREVTGELDEDLLERAHASWAIRAERTNDSLRRRFQRFGQKHYTTFAAVSEGRERGYIVLRRTNVQGFDVMAILDLAVPDDAAEARRSLLVHACREAVRAGCDAAACLERPGTAEARALRSCLFFRTPASFTLIADRDSRRAAQANEWYANWFDHDYI